MKIRFKLQWSGAVATHGSFGCVNFVAGILLTLFAAIAIAQEKPFPLEPPDTFSPRGTLATLTDSVDEAWRLFEARDPGWKKPAVR